jgi:hypothetical protein
MSKDLVQLSFYERSMLYCLAFLLICECTIACILFKNPIVIYTFKITKGSTIPIEVLRIFRVLIDPFNVKKVERH